MEWISHEIRAPLDSALGLALDLVCRPKMIMTGLTKVEMSSYLTLQIIVTLPLLASIRSSPHPAFGIPLPVGEGLDPLATNRLREAQAR